MKRVLVGALTCGLLVAMFPAAVAGASTTFKIEDEVTISSGSGSFVASGPAVDAGLVCPIGTSTTTEFLVMSEKKDIVELWFEKEFTCQDGSGSWTALLDVRLNRNTARTTAAWEIGPIDGSGEYEDLTAAGRLRGDPIVPGVSILDIYRGKVE